MGYEEMSDFDITTRVASYVAERGWLSVAKSTRSDSELMLKYQNGPGCTRNEYVDYCNNPSDAWPIIVGSRIELAFVNGAWRASSLMAGYDECRHENPLRAAMIVFLMMNDEKCQKS